MSHACHRFLKFCTTHTFDSLLRRCRTHCACHTKRRLNLQKWSESGAFHVLTSKCASRHNTVHLFDISTSKSAPNPRCFERFDLQTDVLPAATACKLRTRRFSEPTFGPSEPRNIGKTQCFATFLPFRAPWSSFFLSLIWSSFFCLSLPALPTSAFPSVHSVGVYKDN